MLVDKRLTLEVVMDCLIKFRMQTFMTEIAEKVDKLPVCKEHTTIGGSLIQPLFSPMYPPRMSPETVLKSKIDFRNGGKSIKIDISQRKQAWLFLFSSSTDPM